LPLWLHCIGLSFFPFSFEKKLKERETRKELTNFLTLKNAQMKTAEKNAKVAQGATAKGNEVRTENRPSLTGKEAKKDETVKDQTPAQAPKVEEAKVAESTPGGSATVDNHIANPEQQAGEQEVKAEAAPKVEAKAELTLEAKIKAVNDLHRKTIQRLALIARIHTLEEFEVKLEEENDELENNPYQGCKLIIEDDKRRQFVTNTPGLIRMVSQFIFDACAEKLAEIESNIYFPQA
jgi:hypothetical protein